MVATGRKNPGASARMKARWQDPAWRAKLTEAKTLGLKLAWATRRDEIVAAQNAGKATEAARQNRAAGAKRRWADPEQRAQRRESAKRSWANPDTRPILLAGLARVVAGLRPEQVEARVTAAREGIKRSWAGNQARRDAYAARLQNHYGRYEYLDRKSRLWNLRSGDTWERGFARWLDANALNWRYEPDRILLSDGRIYIPDFWIEEWQTYVEVKGTRPNALEKVHVALGDGIPVIVVGRFAMRRFLRCLR
jgi:hypothetical protein